MLRTLDASVHTSRLELKGLRLLQSFVRKTSCIGRQKFVLGASSPATTTSPPHQAFFPCYTQGFQERRCFACGGLKELM